MKGLSSGSDSAYSDFTKAVSDLIDQPSEVAEVKSILDQEVV
jgi:hypothetical protein